MRLRWSQRRMWCHVPLAFRLVCQTGRILSLALASLRDSGDEIKKDIWSFLGKHNGLRCGNSLHGVTPRGGLNTAGAWSWRRVGKETTPTRCGTSDCWTISRRTTEYIHQSGLFIAVVYFFPEQRSTCVDVLTLNSSSMRCLVGPNPWFWKVAEKKSLLRDRCNFLGSGLLRRWFKSDVEKALIYAT